MPAWSRGLLPSGVLSFRFVMGDTRRGGEMELLHLPFEP
jgi:hypothetical protein